MAFLNATVVTVQQHLGPYGLAISFAAISLLAAAAHWLWPASSDRPPMLRDLIPYVSNTYQYMTDMRTFLGRVGIVGFHLGPMKVYIIAGSRNVQAMFRTSTSVSSDKFMILVMETLWGATKEDLAKFVNDKSGRLKTPAPGTEKTPDDRRYWAGFHHVMHEYLARTQEANTLARSFQRLFGDQLEKYPIGEWATVHVFKFLRKEMAEAAIVSLAGPRILRLNPNFLKEFWDFDEVAASLAWGLPKWMNRAALNKRDRVRAACARYLEAAWAGFDWSGPDADSDWEENFGSRFMRELARWMKESGLSLETSSGIVATAGMFGQNSNTIPMATWGVIELARDPDLFQAVREEVLKAYVTDPTTGKRTIDAQKLLELPLLQSIYVETLRLHMSINITREIMEPMVLEGYNLERGALLQAPSEIAHYDEGAWASGGHPASQFWAARHVQYAEKRDEAGRVARVPQFVMAGRSNEFFPYGGGISMCPGRFFAKQEIMMALAMLVARFDIEFVRWTKLDGSPSDRPAENDMRWAGGAAVPPDRDMEVRWKRLW